MQSFFEIRLFSTFDETILVASADFPKAFDIVVWNFLFTFLSFGGNFICLIQILNLKQKFSTSDPFTLVILGTLQECPPYTLL